MTITDDDAVPKVSVSDAAAAEGGTARVTVSLDRPSSKDVTVWWQASDGTAGGDDHSAPSAKQKITFKAGETSKVIEIKTTQDTIHEGSESFTVTLSDPVGATLGKDSAAAVTITDDDAVPKVSIADATAAEGGTARVTVSLDRPSSKDVTVWWQAADGTAGSGDHAGPSAKQKITFKAGETSKTIEIKTTQDTIHEGDESFTVTLSDPAGAILGKDPSATVTITDDDAAPQVSIADADAAEGGTARVTVSLDRPSSQDITVLWQASEGDHSAPSAKQKITFKAGETSKTIEIKTTQDTIHEGSESFTVTLSDPAGATLVKDPSATVTITDDDAVPEITIANAAAAEGGTARVTVSLDRASSKDVTVWWQAADGTATGADHSAPSAKRKITFKAGETSKTIEVGTVQDAIHEGDETFTVTLSDPAGAALGTDSTATVTITDDDDAVPEISVSDATVAEGETARVTVSLDRASSKDVTVWWQASDGTAGSGDHSAPSAKQKITFKAGETSKVIEIGAARDGIHEGSEAFTVTLSDPAGAALGADHTAAVTITDNDPVPAIVVADTAVTEGETVSAVIFMSNASSEDVTVWWRVVDGSAGGDDHSGPSAKQKVTFRPGETSKTISIATIDDDVREGSESFTIQLSDPEGAELGMYKHRAAVRIRDNDPVPEISVSDAAVTEGGTARVTVSLDRPSSKDITVQWSVSDGTAGGDDHSAPSAKQKIVFKAGETSKVIEIETVDDDVHEGSESFTVTLSDPEGAALGTDSTAAVTVADDEPDGGAGDDRIVGGAGDDLIRGRGGSDQLKGGDGDDLIRGGGGEDEVFGGRGADRLHGGGGADRLHGGKDGDILDGAGGDDHLDGGRGDDELDGGGGDDRLLGGGGSDTVRGGKGWDWLFGGTGADILDGAGGWDELDGGGGSDRLRGGAGEDWLRGGEGADTFVYDDRRFGSDWIDDFEDGADRLDLRGSGAGWDDISVSRDPVHAGTAVIHIRGTKDTISLSGVDAGLIGQDDFIF